MTHIRTAALAAALVAGAAAAQAQTTVITREPVESRTVVTTEPRPVVTTAPLQLTPVQRQTIYRTVTRERVTTGGPTVEYRVGTRVPADAQLYAMPEAVVTEVPAVKQYKYMTVNNRVVIIDPETSQVVDEVVE